jgi:hypothetical protein
MFVPNYIRITFLYALCGILLFSSITDLHAQKRKKKKQEAEIEEVKEEDKKKEEDKPKPISELVKKHQKFDGLFTFYQDSTSGEMKMIVKQDQIGKEYIHFYYIENGPVDAGAFRGNYRSARIFKIEKYFNNIRFVFQNTSAYFDPENAISKSADANYSPGVLFSAKIKAGSEDEGAWLIEADDLLKKEAFGMIKPTPPSKPNPKAFSLGSLSSDKTSYLKIKNYPANTDIVVEYVYENSAPKNFGSDAVTDARNVSIIAQHSMIEVPDNDYEPRLDDPRVGYFTNKVTDMTSTSVTPYRDQIHRWHLKKKDPSAAVSEPVEPLVYWIENTTPVELRPIIKEAGERWNKAFEAAGFKNAIVMKIQPDDAEWDAGDIRYNVIRWTSSPDPPFGGYGPSFVNPRTGQILGADIMLEFIYITYRVYYDKLFASAALSEYHEEEFEHLYAGDDHYCSYGLHHHMNNVFGHVALNSMGATEELKSELIKESIYELVLHEMGHTLGLMHNFKASQLRDIESLYDNSATQDEGMTASVMDYAPIVVAEDPEKQGEFFTTTPGLYDIWAIEYGYKEVGSEDELKAILNRSNERGLAFGNDADDMRSPGRGIDPRINVGDMSSDPITFAVNRLKISNSISEKLIENYKDENGKSYHELRSFYLLLTGSYSSAASTVSRYIGGVYVDRSMIGQEGGTKPLIPVEEEKQKNAMATLNKYLFAPDAFNQHEEIFNYLQIQRRGFDFFDRTEDPKIHDRILNIQKIPLNHILHPVTLKRISDTELYGNEYSLATMMKDLKEAIFRADAYKNVNTFRQNLQVEYVKKLLAITDPGSKGYTNMAKSMALYNLKDIRKMMSASSGNLSTRAHRQHIAFMIDKALEVK